MNAKIGVFNTDHPLDSNDTDPDPLPPIMRNKSGTNFKKSFKAVDYVSILF